MCNRFHESRADIYDDVILTLRSHSHCRGCPRVRTWWSSSGEAVDASANAQRRGQSSRKAKEKEKEKEKAMLCSDKGT